jgi:hypothetical protein
MSVPRALLSALEEASFHLRTVAYHEAGHAVMGHILGFKVEEVTVAGCGLLTAYTRYDEETRQFDVRIRERATRERWRATTTLDEKAWVERRVQAALGGVTAQLLLNELEARPALEAFEGLGGDKPLIDDLADLVTVNQIASAAYVNELGERVRSSLSDPSNWALVERVSGQLQRRGCLDAKAFEDIVRGRH